MSEVIPHPGSPGLMLRALRALPRFRGRERLARTFLSQAERTRCIVIGDRFGNLVAVPNTAEPVGFHLALDGSYEPEVVGLLRSVLKPGDDFLDIGANIGVFTVALARHARRVVAVEASPAVLPYLRWNVKACGAGRIDVLPCAVAAPGVSEVPFYIPPMDHFGMGSSAPQFDSVPIAIPARTIDSIVAELGLRPAALKIDVEGFEAHAFLGATELLHSAAAPLIAFEFCDWAEERAFPGRKGWAQEILAEAGYCVWKIEDYLAGAPPLAKPVTTGFMNLVACKP